MVNAKDRTHDFRDAVRAIGLSSGHNEAKLAAISASFIIHKPKQMSPFVKTALKTLENIVELDHFIVKHRKNYVDLHRLAESERDDIEHEVSSFVKACKEQIDILKNRIYDEKNANDKSRRELRDKGSQADLIAHKHGVVLILSEQLHSVTMQFDRLRSIRFQHAVNRAPPRRNLQKRRDIISMDTAGSDSTDREMEISPSGPVRIHDQLLDDETRVLQVELTSLLDSVQETETKMVELSALNHLMSTHVLQQAQQIEQLYEQAIEATNNVELGNRELSQAIQRNSSSRTFLLFFLFVLTFSILFLDWYS